LSKQLLLGAASALEKSDHPLWITGVEPPRYVLPVRINGRLAGILSVIPAHAQLEGEIAFTLECVATYAQIAAGRLLASHDTARATLLRRSLTTTEAERMRIAQDLRDNSSQNLVALKVELACAAAALEKNPAAATGHLDNAQRVADSLLTEINTTSTNLRPNELDYLGFAKAIETYATRELAPSSCAFRLAGNALTADFSPLVELHLLRVAQEGVRNIARHARADEAVLTLNHEGDFVTLYLADNGCGFDVATQPLESNAPGAYGLKSMRDRIDMMGGRFWIGSQPGAGTRIICRIPCEEALA
jgi:two-component system NarL family sensor kinase